MDLSEIPMGSDRRSADLRSDKHLQSDRLFAKIGFCRYKFQIRYMIRFGIQTLDHISLHKNAHMWVHTHTNIIYTYCFPHRTPNGCKGLFHARMWIKSVAVYHCHNFTRLQREKAVETPTWVRCERLCHCTVKSTQPNLYMQNLYKEQGIYIYMLCN